MGWASIFVFDCFVFGTTYNKYVYLDSFGRKFIKIAF